MALARGGRAAPPGPAPASSRPRGLERPLPTQTPPPPPRRHVLGWQNPAETLVVAGACGLALGSAQFVARGGLGLSAVEIACYAMLLKLAVGFMASTLGAYSPAGANAWDASISTVANGLRSLAQVRAPSGHAPAVPPRPLHARPPPSAERLVPPPHTPPLTPTPADPPPAPPPAPQGYESLVNNRDPRVTLAVTCGLWAVLVMGRALSVLQVAWVVLGTAFLAAPAWMHSKELVIRGWAVAAAVVDAQCERFQITRMHRAIAMLAGVAAIWFYQGWTQRAITLLVALEVIRCQMTPGDVVQVQKVVGPVTDRVHKHLQRGWGYGQEAVLRSAAKANLFQDNNVWGAAKRA